jgi:hypothetical protein
LDLTVASGEKRNEELLETFYNDKIVKDSSGPERYRCEICSKMFKGPIYVKKHISVKHQDKLEEIRDRAREEQFFQNFVTHSDKVKAVQEKEAKEREKEQVGGNKNASPSDRGRPNNRSWERNNREGGRSDRLGFGNRQDYNRNRSPNRDRDVKRPRDDDDRVRVRDGGWGDNNNRARRNFDSRDRIPWGDRGGKSLGWGDKNEGWGDQSNNTVTGGEKEKEKAGEEKPAGEGEGWVEHSSKNESSGWADLDKEKDTNEDKSEDKSVWGGSGFYNKNNSWGERSNWNNRDGAGFRERVYSRESVRGGRRPMPHRWGEKENFYFPPPPEFKGKMDPRARPQYKDLDQPKEDSFEIDYEKALAAFADSGDS